MRPYPPNSYGPGEAYFCLEQAQMPAAFSDYLDRQLEASLGVSTHVLATHLAEFFEVADARLISRFCSLTSAPEAGPVRPLAIPTATYRGLSSVAERSGLEINQVIMILLSADPQDLFPGGEEVVPQGPDTSDSTPTPELLFA
ncbi:MAG: hypothetical protein J0M12_02940 [Deltaproteobacteria bacterium]|nr:hypothetical protein [Deltaproteobacteria bacterium]